MNSEIVTSRCESELSEIYAVMLQYNQTDFSAVNGDHQAGVMLLALSVEETAAMEQLLVTGETRS